MRSRKVRNHLQRLYRDGAAVFKLSSLKMDTWFSSHHLWHIYRDGTAVFKASSLEMVTWFSSHYLRHLYRDGAAVFKVSSLEMHTWFSKPSSPALLQRWYSCFQRINGFQTIISG